MSDSELRRRITPRKPDLDRAKKDVEIIMTSFAHSGDVAAAIEELMRKTGRWLVEEAQFAKAALDELFQNHPKAVRREVSSETARALELTFRSLSGTHDEWPPLPPGQLHLSELLDRLPQYIDNEQLERVTKLRDVIPDQGHSYRFETLRQLAASELRRREEGRSLIYPLLEALGSEEDFVRDAAINKLEAWSGSDLQTLTDLVTALGDQSSLGHRYEGVVSSRGRVGKRSQGWKQADEARRVLETTFGRMVHDADVDVLLALLTRVEGGPRLRVIRALGGKGDPRSCAPLVSELRQAVGNDDRNAIDEVAKAIEAIGADATNALIESLHDDAPTVRWVAADILGRVGNKSAIAALEEAVLDEDDAVRDSAQLALERIPDRRT